MFAGDAESTRRGKERTRSVKGEEEYEKKLVGSEEEEAECIEQMGGRELENILKRKENTM